MSTTDGGFRPSGRRRSRLSGNRLDLPLVIEVVTRHCFDENLKRHITAFGVCYALRKSIGRHRFDQLEIPISNGGEHTQSCVRVAGFIVGGPSILIEGLDDMVRLGERLPQAKGKHQLAIRQMAHDLPCAPLTGREGPFDAISTKRIEQLSQPARGRGDDFQRILIS